MDHVVVAIGVRSACGRAGICDMYVLLTASRCGRCLQSSLWPSDGSQRDHGYPPNVGVRRCGRTPLRRILVVAAPRGSVAYGRVRLCGRVERGSHLDRIWDASVWIAGTEVLHQCVEKSRAKKLPNDALALALALVTMALFLFPQIWLREPNWTPWSWRCAFSRS
jgi:hypothetical protein